MQNNLGVVLWALGLVWEVVVLRSRLFQFSHRFSGSVWVGHCGIASGENHCISRCSVCMSMSIVLPFSSMARERVSWLTLVSCL